VEAEVDGGHQEGGVPDSVDPGGGRESGAIFDHCHGRPGRGALDGEDPHLTSSRDLPFHDPIGTSVIVRVPSSSTSNSTLRWSDGRPASTASPHSTTSATPRATPSTPRPSNSH